MSLVCVVRWIGNHRIDCVQKSAQVDLVKPASSIAAGLAPHDVAIGDVVGVAWLYDMRRPDTPRLRLPCGPSHAVTSMQWVPRPSSLDGRSCANRKPGGALSLAQGAVQVPSNPTGIGQLNADAAMAAPAPPLGGVTSALPRAPVAAREQRRVSVAAPRPLAQTLRTGATVPIPVHQNEASSIEHDGQSVNDEAILAAVFPPPGSSLGQPMRAAKIDDGSVDDRQDHPGSSTADLRGNIDGHARESAPRSSPLVECGNVGMDVQCLHRVTEAAVERVMDTHLAKLRQHMEDVESRILSRIVSRGTTESPAYHTQQVSDHLDKASVSIKRDVQSWLAESQQETLKQFHLAQQDLMDVAAALGHQIASLTASVEQLQARITLDEENRRKIAQFM